MDDNYFLGRLRDLVTFQGLRLNYLSHVFCLSRPRFFVSNVHKDKLTPPATCPVPPYAEYDPASTFVISGFICATNRFHVYASTIAVTIHHLKHTGQDDITSKNRVVSASRRDAKLNTRRRRHTCTLMILSASAVSSHVTLPVVGYVHTTVF